MNASTRTAIVTGASGGIGRAVAGRLVRDGFAVVLNNAGNPASADKAVAELRAAGGQALAVRANVADVGEVGQLFGATVQQFGGIDVVVHCAGIMPLRPPRFLRRDGRERPAPFARGTDHRLLQQRGRQIVSEVWRVQRVQGRGGVTRSHARERAARP